MPEGLWARADCGVETVRSPEGCARFDNPSVSFADSSLYTREPKSGWSVYGDDFLCTREPGVDGSCKALLLAWEGAKKPPRHGGVGVVGWLNGSAGVTV